MHLTPPFKPERNRFASVVLLGAVSVVVLLCCLKSFLSASLADNQHKTLAIYQALQIGMSPGQVNGIIVSHSGFKSLPDSDGNLWAASPVLPGAANWNVCVSFKSNKASRIAIRDMDNPKGPKPGKAPPDKHL